MKRQYGYYTCEKCNSRHRAWIESLCYKSKLCPKCIDKKLSFSLKFDIENVMGWTPIEELAKHYRC